MTDPDEKALAPLDATLPAPAGLEDDLRYAADLAADTLADATQKDYASDWRAWAAYAEAHGLEEYPVVAAGLAAWLGHMAKRGLAVSTLRRRCAAVSFVHRTRDPEGIPPTADPRVKRVLAGIARRHTRPPSKKKALSVELVRAMVERIDSDDHGNDWTQPRDRTLLLVGFATGMRRSELARLQWSEIEWKQDGVVLFIARSKTDQRGEGQYVAIPKNPDPLNKFCPVGTLQDWRTIAGVELEEEPRVFACSEKTINRIVQRHVKRVTLGDEWKQYGAHSFRSGFASEAHKAGATLEDVMVQTRHRSRDVAAGYIQHGEKMQNPAVGKLLERLTR